MDIFWYLLIEVLFKLSAVLGTLPFSVRISEGQMAWLPMRIMQEPGYDFENNNNKNGGKFYRVQHYGVWLHDIEQTCGRNMLKTLY